MKGCGENFFEKEEGDEAEQNFNIYICARLMLSMHLFLICVHIFQKNQTRLSIIDEFVVHQFKKKTTKKKTQNEVPVLTEGGLWNNCFLCCSPSLS